MDQPTTITRGDLKPDALIVLSDRAEEADFSALTPSMVWVTGEMGDVVLFKARPVAVTAAIGGASTVVRYGWASGDTDFAGRMYIKVVVEWPGGEVQHFPKGSPLILDIRRAPGDD